MNYQKEEIKFGDLMVLLEKHPTLFLFVGIGDDLSLRAKSVVFGFFRNKPNEKVVYLHYDQNKSLMIDLNIRKIPALLIFRNMELETTLYMPTLLKDLEKYYEQHISGQSS